LAKRAADAEAARKDTGSIMKRVKHILEYI
jgi:hypothetical protein